MPDTAEQGGDRIRFAHAATAAADPDLVTEELAAALEDFGPIDLLQVFVSAHHGEEAARIAAGLRARLTPGTLLAVTAEAVAAGDRELERTPAVTALAARLPRVKIHGFAIEKLAEADPDDEAGRRVLRETLGVDDSLVATIVLADPYSIPLRRLMPALNEARSTGRDGKPAGVVVGGLASGGGKAGQNALILDDRVLHRGMVGVSLSGPVRVDAVVSQGCRPIGENMVITSAKANAIYQFGGRPALEVVTEILDSLEQADRQLLKRGLFLGRVVSEYKDRYGRGDYLIRNVSGVNPKSNVIAVQDLVRAGQTVRLHIRDQQAATEDLELILDAQKLHGPPAGVLMITCTGRGRNLFDDPHHDASAIQRAFQPEDPGADKAKPGEVLDPGARRVPLAGFFASGEIGPVGEQSYLHGHSVCAVMFRQ